jgi:hypothetical protein
MTAFKVANYLLTNDGHGRFTNVSASAGSGLALIESSRGAGFDDLDNDGDVDGVLLNCDAPANVLMNTTPRTSNWIEIELCGTRSSRSAVGSRVTILANNRLQSSEIHAGRSYQSHYGTRLHFGLGQSEQIERLEVHWHSGSKQLFTDVRVNQILQIAEP